jgi:tetratricopeptide (TPR) repeat protein
MESLHQAYAHIAQRLEISGWNNEKADFKRLVQLHLSKDSAGQWLLIFDNLDDIKLLTTDYLPRSEQGCIVFTTSIRETAVSLASSNIVQIPNEDQDIALRMLQRYLINQRWSNEQQYADLLLKELTYLPLGIVLSAAYISRNNITVKDYLSLLNEQEEEVIKLLSDDFENELRYRAVKNPIATAWLISFRQIHRFNALAADYLSFMACVERKDILQSLLPTGAPREKQMEAIETLTAYSLIVKRPAGSALDLHRLVHLTTRNWLRKQHSLDRWTNVAIKCLLDIFPDSNHRNRSKWRRLLPHATYALRSGLIDEDNKNGGDLAWKCARSLVSDGRYNEAEVYFEEAVRRRKRVLGQDHPDTLTAMGNLAVTYWNQGRQKEAEELQEQEMEISKSVLGTEHPSTLISMGNLAFTYRNQGRWKEAEELLVQVIQTRKKLLGIEHPNTITSMANLVFVYKDQGRLKEALELEVQVVDMRKKILNPEHPDMLDSMSNLAGTYVNQGRWKEAEELEVEVMETRKRVLGEDHPRTLDSMTYLASMFKDQGRWKEAQELESQVMEMRKRVLSIEHPDMLTSMGNLALTYNNQGRLKEAEELEVQVMETRKKTLGVNHPST